MIISYYQMVILYTKLTMGNVFRYFHTKYGVLLYRQQYCRLNSNSVSISMFFLSHSSHFLTKYCFIPHLHSADSKFTREWTGKCRITRTGIIMKKTDFRQKTYKRASRPCDFCKFPRSLWSTMIRPISLSQDRLRNIFLPNKK